MGNTYFVNPTGSRSYGDVNLTDHVQVVGTYGRGQRCVSQIYARSFIILFPYHVVDDGPSRNTMGFSGGLGSSPAAIKCVRFKISRLIMMFIMVLTSDDHELNALMRWLSERGRVCLWDR